MTLTTLLLADLEREADRSKRALEQVPDGQHDWKPHERSMAFGYLANMVATMPSWMTMIIRQDQRDIAPAGGGHRPTPSQTRAELLEALATSLAGAKAALEATTDAHLMTPWQLLAGGKVVAEAPRHVMLRDTLSHLAHHRGQMTVYLRLMGSKVPALFGPSADDRRF